MEAIKENVFIENQYSGVTLGVINQPRGLIQIDAPPSPEDGRSWRAALMSLDSGPERVLVNLDAHPDRTLGVRVMDCTVIAHEKTAQIFRSRPSAFKAQSEDSGGDWEAIAGLGGIRWMQPEISFTQNLTLYWGNVPVLLESHPGPSSGAIWVILPEEKIVFVGDAVVKNQPPFLANADLPSWLETLELLQRQPYREYTIVSGRGGVVPAAIVKSQADFLKELLKKLEKLAAKQSPPEALEGLAQEMVATFKASGVRAKQYIQRLQYGLSRYYSRHYHTGGDLASAEE
ncbi:MAG: hypothetical protein Fur0043_11580 [Anaerolineales bacterium]